MRSELQRLVSFGLIITALTVAESSAQSSADHSGLRLDRMEVQRFEAGYEAWIQSLVQQVLPKAEVSILSELNYSTDSDVIQNYEERRAADHLPGLPDVSDQNAHPTENPLYELITQQNIKLIFENQPTEDQIRIIKEILGVKLNLDTAHGDQISFDHLHRGNDYVGKAAVSFGKNKKMNFAVILAAILLLTVFMTRRNKITLRQKETGEKEINAYYAKVNPIESILKTDAKLLISTLRKQDVEFIVQLMAHAPVMFNQIVLQVFEEEQRKELFEAFQNQRLKVSRKKSRYSQLLFAAKLHDELKLEAIQQVDVLNDLCVQINEQRANMQESLKQLKALYVVEESAQQEIEEGSHEASL